MLNGRQLWSSVAFTIFLVFTAYLLLPKSTSSYLKTYSLHVCAGLDKKIFPGRNSGWPRRSRKVGLSPSLKLNAALQLANALLLSSLIILLAGDVSINPGPDASFDCPLNLSTTSSFSSTSLDSPSFLNESLSSSSSVNDVRPHAYDLGLDDGPPDSSGLGPWAPGS